MKRLMNCSLLSLLVAATMTFNYLQPAHAGQPNKFKGIQNLGQGNQVQNMGSSNKGFKPNFQLGNSNSSKKPINLGNNQGLNQGINLGNINKLPKPNGGGNSNGKGPSGIQINPNLGGIINGKIQTKPFIPGKNPISNLNPNLINSLNPAISNGLKKTLPFTPGSKGLVNPGVATTYPLFKHMHGIGHHHHFHNQCFWTMPWHYPFSWCVPWYCFGDYGYHHHCGVVLVDNCWTYVEQPILECVTVLPVSTVVTDDLMDIPAGASFKIPVMNLNPEAGYVVLKTNGLSMQAEVLKWELDGVTVRLPSVGIDSAMVSDLYVVAADGNVAYTLHFSMIPLVKGVAQN